MSFYFPKSESKLKTLIILLLTFYSHSNFLQSINSIADMKTIIVEGCELLYGFAIIIIIRIPFGKVVCERN